MSNELRFPAGGRDGRDEELGELLRPLYAAPAAEGYWDDLQASVLRHVNLAAAPAPHTEWWHVLDRWSRVGAAAAAVIAALAGAAWVQHRAAEARMAYEAVLAQPPVYSMEFDADGGGGRPPDAAARLGLP